MASAEIQVEVVYALPGRAISKLLKLPQGASVADALVLASASPEFSDCGACDAPTSMGAPAALSASIGIFGKLVAHETVLTDGDRIEIYRPLAADPKTARRARSAQRGPKKISGI
jgi:putative ubiquitin-RnfH superfamily antitoxin RatB of RatAB toxin-antitoxin module